MRIPFTPTGSAQRFGKPTPRRVRRCVVGLASLAATLLFTPSVAVAGVADSHVTVVEAVQLSAVSVRTAHAQLHLQAARGGITASFDAAVPEQARVVVAEVLDQFDSVFDIPVGAVQIAVGWRTLPSLGVGGPVLVHTPQGYYPAAVADTLFGGHHAAGPVDGFVTMGANQPWYFGTEPTVPGHLFDFRSAFAHELVHALGFTVETRVDAPGRRVLSGRTAPLDSALRSGGARLVDLDPPRQSAAFAADDVWLDVGGGRLIPLNSVGSGVSHFGNAVSPSDSQPGALMYSGLINGVRHRLDVPVIGALVQAGLPTSLAPAGPVDLRVETGVLKWRMPMAETAPPPVTILVTASRGNTVVDSTVLPGAVQQYVLPTSMRDSTITVSAVSASGAATESSIRFGVTTMATAATLEELVRASDYRSHDADVLRLYWAFFNRQPDVSGARYWVSMYQNGMSLERIAAAFAGSWEFRTRYGSAATNEAYLTVIYQNVLGRPRDNGGFGYWLGLLNSGRLDRGSVVRWIAAAPEFINAHPY